MKQTLRHLDSQETYHETPCQLNERHKNVSVGKMNTIKETIKCSKNLSRYQIIGFLV